MACSTEGLVNACLSYCCPARYWGVAALKARTCISVWLHVQVLRWWKWRGALMGVFRACADHVAIMVQADRVVSALHSRRAAGGGGAGAAGWTNSWSIGQLVGRLVEN